MDGVRGVPETTGGRTGRRLERAELILEKLESRELTGGGQSFQPSINSPLWYLVMEKEKTTAIVSARKCQINDCVQAGGRCPVVTH